MSPQQLRQHYLQLWYLLQSLDETWWTANEKDSILNALKAAVPNDHNLSGLNINASDFLIQLADSLETILAARQEIPSGNMPPQEVFEEYRKALAQKESPWVFLEEKEKQRKPLLVSDSVFRILKQNQLIDDQNRARVDVVRKTNPPSLDKAQKEIGRLLALERARESLTEQMFLALQPSRNPVPVGLLEFEFFGDNRRMGIVNRVASEVITALAKGKSFEPKIATNILNKYLNNSSVFQSFDRDRQLGFKKQALRAIFDTVSGYTLPNDDKIVITQKGRDVEIQVIPHGDPARGTYNVYSTPSKPRNIRETVQRELNLPETALATRNIEKFIGDFASNPIGTVLGYPLGVVPQLLPEPLKRAYFKRKAWQKKIQIWYGLTVSTEAQRKALEQLGIKAVKAIGKQFGIVTKDDHWAPVAALGWVTDKTVTLIGEGFSKLTSFIPAIGKPISKRISRRVGKNRKREESIATGVAGLVLDTVILAPKLLWWLTNKLPFVKALRVWLGSKWLNLRFALETRFPILKFLRLGKIGLGSFLKAIPHGLISGGLTYIIFPGAPPITPWAVGTTEFLFRFWRNLSLNESFLTWAQGPHTTGLGSTIGRLFPSWSRWAYLPVKGPLIGYGIGTLLGLPIWARVGLSILSAGIEYGYYAGLKPLLPSFIAKWITGPLGRFFGAILSGLPAGLALPQILIGLGVSPLTAWLIGLPLGTAGLWALLKFVLPALSPYTAFGWLGWMGGGWLATKLGLGPLGIGLFKLGGFSLFTGGGYLFWSWVTGHGTYIFLSSFFSILAQTVWGSITAAFAAIPTAAVLYFLSVMALILAFVGIIVIIVTGAFQINPREIALRRGLQNPQLPVDKILTNVEKSANGILSLEYKITFSYKPNISAPPALLTDVKIEDRFEEIPPATGSFAFGTAIGGVFDNLSQAGINPTPSVIKPCLPSAIFGSSLVWEQSGCQLLQIGPNQTQTISLQLVFREPWSVSSLTFNKDKLCNVLIITAKTTPDGQNLTSSLPRLCVDRDTGEILPAAEDAVALAQQIVAVLQNCRADEGRGELITVFDQSNLEDAVACLEKGDIPPHAINEFIRSVSMYGSFQCVGLPMMAEAATGGALPDLSRSLGISSAEEFWFRREELTGYLAIPSNNYNNIAPGDIMIWSNSLGGHFAMVTDVIRDPDGNASRIMIVEASSPQAGVVNSRPIAVTDAGIDAPPGTLLGWLRRE